MRTFVIVVALGTLVACHKGTKGGSNETAPSASPHGSTDRAAAIKPPSTGKEFVAPKIKAPTKDEARTMFATAIAAATKKDCAKAVDAHAQTGFHFAEIDADYVKQYEAGLLAVARCAEGAHYYRLMGGIAADLSKADPKFHPELLARALMGIGKYKEAGEVLRDAQRALPRDGDIAVTIAKVMCKVEQWADCLKAADGALRIVGAPTTPEAKEIAWRADKYRARALLYTGKFADATKAADDAEKLGAPEKELDEVKKLAVRGDKHHMLVEASFGRSIPIGGYHLFGKVASLGPVVKLRVANFDAKDQEVKVEAEIPGFTERMSKTVTVLHGKTETVDMSPPMKASYDVNSVRADMTSQLSLKVTKTDGNDVALDQSESITLMPRDSLPLARVMEDGEMRWTPEFIAAWITPNAKAIDTFLSAAKKRLPEGQSFSGGQSATMPQVKAIYDELHERGMSYVMDPGLFVDGELVQRTRLPTDVLASTNAQCIEGAILYATLLEAIGLRPIVTLAKGHSWAGWHPEGHDAAPARAPRLYWLETTVTHAATFEQALATGDRMYYVTHASDWVAPTKGSPTYGYVDITSLRSKGVSAQPWDL